MKLPDFMRFEPLNRLRDKMKIPREVEGSIIESSPEIESPPLAAPLALPAPKPRAFILLQSGNRLDLLDPLPDAWTDEDLAIGLSLSNGWYGKINIIQTWFINSIRAPGLSRPTPNLSRRLDG